MPVNLLNTDILGNQEEKDNPLDPLSAQGPVDFSSLDTQTPVDAPIATTQSDVQQLPPEPSVTDIAEVTEVTDVEPDISMFSDVPSDTQDIQEDFGVHTAFSDIPSDASVMDLENTAKENQLARWTGDIKRKEAKIADAPVDIQSELSDTIYGKELSRPVSNAMTTMEFINEHGGALGLADRLAGHGLRGVAGVLDFVTLPVAWGIGKVPGIGQPSFLDTLSHYFPEENYEFRDADNLLVDDALRVAGVAAEFGAGGGVFGAALSGAAKVTSLVSRVPVGPNVTKTFSTISDDLLMDLPRQLAFDTISGAAYQGTKEILGDDSEVLPIMNSLLFPMLATKGGRDLLVAGGRSSLNAVNKASDYTLIAPLLKRASGNFLDNKAANISRESSANPEAFTQGMNKWKKTLAENWTAKRVKGIDEAMVAESATEYFNSIINFKDTRVLERQTKVTTIEDNINEWRKTSGSLGLPEFQMPIYVAYRGVTDNTAMDFLEQTYKQTFPELHMKATRDRVETVQAFVKSKGEQSSAEDVALLRGLTDELSTALEDRIQREATGLTPRSVQEVDAVLGAREREIQTAGSLRKSIAIVDDLTDDAYVQMTEGVNRELPLSSGLVLKAVDDIIASDAKNILQSKKEVPAYVIEVYQGVKANRPEAAVSPAEQRLQGIDVEKRELDIMGADRNQAFLQDLSGFDASIASKLDEISSAPKPQKEALNKEIAALKKDRAHTVSSHKAETAINTAKKKPLIAEQKKLELEVKKEKIALGRDDPAALVADMLPVNSGEVIDSIKRVNKLIRDESRGISPDFAKIDNLQKIKGSLEETMGELSEQGLEGQATLGQWERSNSFYRNQIADKIDATALGTKYLKRTKDGKNFALYDEDIVDTAWNSAKLKDIDDTLRLATDTAETSKVLKSLEDGDIQLENLDDSTKKIIEDYKDLGVSSLMKELSIIDNTLGGRIEDPAKYMEAMKKTALQWLDDHSAKVNRIPGLKTEVNRILANNEEFFQRIGKYNELVAAREGPEISALLKSMGHSSNVQSIIKDNESSNALATAIEGLISEGYAVPKIQGLEIPELQQFQRLLGIQGSSNFKELLAKQYRSSVWDGDTFNATAVRADLDNPSTRANLEKIIGEENVLALDALSDTLLLSGIDDSVKTIQNIKSGETGVVGGVLDKALTLISGNQQKLSSLGSLALRRARGFRPSAEWFQVYLGTSALKYLGNQGSAAYVKAVIENHRKLGNIDKALGDLSKASHAATALKVFTEELSWSNLPLAYRNDSALALRRVLQAVGLNINHQEALAVVERTIKEEGGRREVESGEPVSSVPVEAEVTLDTVVTEEPEAINTDSLIPTVGNGKITLEPNPNAREDAFTPVIGNGKITLEPNGIPEETEVTQ